MMLLLVTGLLACGMVRAKDALTMDRGVLVNLFEWKYEDIAKECVDFLAPMGYTGVIISPPSENLVKHGRPWFERYQPVSYELVTRSGNEEDLKKMLRTCNQAGISVIADAVLNHMSSNSGPNCKGTAGSRCDADHLSYEAVPYTKEHFHANPQFDIVSYKISADHIRKGELGGLHDLNQSHPHVRKVQAAYLNKLISIGFAGFRLDAAKHVHPDDFKAIIDMVQDLNTEFGFPANTRPFVYSEVIDLGGEKVTYDEYTGLGPVTDFRYGNELALKLKSGLLKDLETFCGPKWPTLPEHVALVFTDNHDTQHTENFLPNHIDFRDSQLHKIAVAFMLAWGHGTPILMSSYEFPRDEETYGLKPIELGPPHDKDFNTLSPNPINNVCQNHWKCEHRWRQIFNMVHFYNVVKGTGRGGWWTNGNNQIAFCRGNKGFIALNTENKELNAEINTCMPPGEYCDVITGGLKNGQCEAGTTVVTVGHDGKARIKVPVRGATTDGILAIHAESNTTFRGERSRPQPRQSQGRQSSPSVYNGYSGGGGSNDGPSVVQTDVRNNNGGIEVSLKVNLPRDWLNRNAGRG